MRDSKDVKEKILLSLRVLVITDYSRVFLLQIKQTGPYLSRNYFINLFINACLAILLFIISYGI